MASRRSRQRRDRRAPIPDFDKMCDCLWRPAALKAAPPAWPVVAQPRSNTVQVLPPCFASFVVIPGGDIEA